MFDPIRAVQYSAEYFARGRIPGTGIQTGGMTDIGHRIGEAQKILTEESETFGRMAEKGQQADEALNELLAGNVGPIGNIITDPEAWAGFIGQAAPSLYTAYKSGGSIPFMAWLEGMEASGSALEFEQRTGQRLSPEQFSQAVAQTAIVNSLLEKYGLDKVLGAPGEKILSSAIKGGLTEGGTEALQQFNGNVAAYVAYDPEQSLTEGVLGSAMGGVGTGAPGGAMSGIARKVSRQTAAGEKATQNAEAMATVAEAAVNSKLRQRDKEAFAEVMNQLLGDEAEDVYLAGDAAKEFFQSEPEALEEAAKSVPTLTESIKEALETGGDVVISAKDYITYFAEYHETLADKIRIGAEGASLQDVEQWKEKDSELFKEEADRILQEREQQTGADQVRQSIKDEITATGRFTGDVADKYAVLHGAFATAMGERLGMKPEEVYDQYGLRVRVPPPAAELTPPPGEVVRAGGALLEQQTLFQEAVDEAREFTKPAVQLFTAIAERQENFKGPETSQAADIETIATDMGADYEWSGTETTDKLHQSRTEHGGRDEAPAVAINDEQGRRVITIHDRDSDTPYATIVPEKGQDIDGATAYQSAMAWAYNNGKTMVPDPAGLTTINRLRRSEAMISSMLRTKTSEHVEPDIDQFVGFLTDKEYAKLNERVNPSKDKEAVKAMPALSEMVRDFPEIEQKLITLKSILWNDEKGASIEEKPSIYENNLNSMMMASSLLTKKRIGDERYKGAVDAATKLIQQGEGAVEDLDFTNVLGINDVRMGVGNTTLLRAALVEAANRSVADEVAAVADQAGVRPLEDGVPVEAPTPGIERGLLSDEVLARVAQAPALERTLYQDYRLEHRAPIKDGANTADDTSDIYPEDIYDPSVSWKYYGHGGDAVQMDKESANIIAELQGEPDAIVTIYRAVPKGVTAINPGDWVTINKNYADFHGKSWVDTGVVETGDYDILELDVKASEIATDGNSIHEWGYSPEGVELYQPAYHGTPHRFDKFSLDAIGTGEGAQAYGWGLYFASSRGVAEWYRDTLSRNRMPSVYDGKQLTKAESRALNRVIQQGLTSARPALRAAIEATEKGQPTTTESIEDMREGLAFLEAIKVFNPGLVSKGELFQVDIPGSEVLLDYDKSFIEQPAHVKNILLPIIKNLEVNIQDISGKRIYQEIERIVLGKEGIQSPLWDERKRLASEYLNDLGIPGLRYLDGTSRGTDGDRHNYVIWDEGQVTIEAVNDELVQAQELLQPGKRGSIQFLEDITKGPSIITLFENADLSTFTHESAHFFFEVMTDIASREDAPQEVIDDFNILLEWYGVKDMDEWASLSPESRRDHHEQFARGFEAYLFEGKAPSVELQSVFQRFRSWLVAVYKSIRGLDVELTDEVRGVLDRLLATEEEIKAAETASSYKPLFDSMEQARMSKSEWDAYQNADEHAIADAQQDLDTRSLRDMKWLSGAKSRVLKELQKEGAAKRKAVKDEVTEELGNEPVYRATKFFKTGETIGPDGEEIKVTQGNKLNKEQILSLFPPAELAAVDLKKLKGMVSIDNGMDLDLAGQMFGFENGDQLVKAILAAPILKDAIEQRTDEVVLERHGDITDPAALEAAANEAVHSEARGRFIASEMRALNRQVGSKAAIIKAAKEYAAEKIAGKKVRDARLPGKYRAAEARAAREAEKSLKGDDIVSAAQHKRAQVLNLYMSRAATDAAAEIDKAINYLKKFERASVRKNLRGDMVDQLDHLLSRFDLRKTPPKEGERESLSEWMQKEAERLDAIIPDLDPVATNEGYRKHYKDLTLDELRGLKDTVKQLEHMARREERMYQERRALNFEQEKQAILKELNNAHPEVFDEEGMPKPYRKDRLPLLKEYRARFRHKFDAEFLNVENLLDIMTADKGDQIFDSIFGRLSEAADAQTRMMKDLGEYLSPYTKAFSLKERAAFSMASSRVFVPEVGEYFTRDKRIAVAMFYGSLDGRQRLMDGNGYTDQQIKAIMRTLTEKDLDFIEAMWEMSDEKVWPELKKLDERTKGVPAKKIDPAPYVVNGRPMRGGYTPLVYDGDLSTRSFDMNLDNAIADMRGGSATHASTRQSASKQRLKEVKRPLDLSLSAISYKINETVHDITHREAVTDTYRLLKSTRLSNAIRSIAGPEVYKAILTKVRETAVNPTVPRGVTEKALWYLRRNTLINMMGASFNTVAINVLGASPAIRRVGPARFAKAVNRIASRDAVKWYKWILEKSPYMRGRIDGFDRDLNTEVNRFTGKAPITPSMGVWFAGLAMMDRAITLPAWIAAYEKSMEESGNNEDLSIKYADRVIRQTQGSGRAIDLAKVSGGVGAAGEFKRIITMYYNFFSGQLGMMVRSKRLSEKYWNEGRRAKAAMEYTLTTLMVIVVPATLEAIARGNCGDDPDAADYMHCTVRSSALFGSSMFPLVRDMMPFAWSQFDPDTPAFGVRISPVENAMETLARTPKSAADVIGGDATDSDIRTLTRGLGYAFGLPGFQASRTIEGYQALIDGETDNPAVLLTGAPR
jgi:hypothetical protein